MAGDPPKEFIEIDGIRKADKRPSMSNFDRGVHEALNRLGLALPEPAPPAGSYKPAVATGGLLFLSAQVPYADGELVYQGRVGAELRVKQCLR